MQIRKMIFMGLLITLLATHAWAQNGARQPSKFVRFPSLWVETGTYSVLAR